MIYAPDLDVELLTELLRILDYCYVPRKLKKRAFNDTAVARALSINRRTLQQLRAKPPLKKWWWTSVIRDAIIQVLPTLPKWKRRNIAKMMRALPDETVEQIENACAARDYVIDMLKDGPAVGTELLLAANRGNLSEYRIKKAAKLLGVIKSREGKGKDHLTVWSLPHWDDEL